MGKLAKSFRDLEVYQLAFKAALEVFEEFKAFPAEEKYSLTGQIRRASRSVCANIGEAWACRKYEKLFSSKLTISCSEGNETQVLLDFALSHKYMIKEDHGRLIDDYNHIVAQLYRMIDEADSWCSSK
jgi:four helix bundle protein